MRTAVSDLPNSRLDFCLKKSIFVSKNCSGLFRNIQKSRHYEERTAEEEHPQMGWNRLERSETVDN